MSVAGNRALRGKGLGAQVVLAYSGGLDTSVILKWLQDEYDCEVVTFTADLGQVGRPPLTPRPCLHDDAMKAGERCCYPHLATAIS